jgi:hypothetical protein
VRSDGRWYGYGPEVEDGISGWLFPVQFMVRQCGVLVSRADKDNSYDRVDSPRELTCATDRVAVPTLTIAATDSEASESGPATGTFRITRDGDTSHALTIELRISGTATNGVDYQTIPAIVTMAAGESFVDIVVTPLTGDAAEAAETVIVTIVPQVTSDYYVDLLNNSATVNIADNPPILTITFELRYEFESSPGFLVNSGTAGTGFNLSQGDICLG